MDVRKPTDGSRKDAREHQQLFGWIESIERALPVERNEL
jgi:hypothetical protein